MKTDSAGQEIKVGDLFFGVSHGKTSCRTYFGRIIKIDDSIHYIKYMWSSCSKNSNPSYFCRIESNPLTQKSEQEIDSFYHEWIKKHKEFR